MRFLTAALIGFGGSGVLIDLVANRGMAMRVVDSAALLLAVFLINLRVDRLESKY